MSGLTRERGDTVIGPRTSQSVLSSLLYREACERPAPALAHAKTRRGGGFTRSRVSKLRHAREL